MSTPTEAAGTLRAKAVDWQDLAGPGWLVVTLDDALDALETARRDTLLEAAGRIDPDIQEWDLPTDYGQGMQTAAGMVREMAGGQ